MIYISFSRKDEVRVWAAKGFEQTIEKWPGIAGEMQRRLCEMADREGNHLLVASFRFLDFTQRRGATRYQALAMAAESAGVWSPVQRAVMNYLETGMRWDMALPKPSLKSQASNKKKQDAIAVA